MRKSMNEIKSKPELKLCARKNILREFFFAVMSGIAFWIACGMVYGTLAFAQVAYDGVFIINDESELLTALSHIDANDTASQKIYIGLDGNVMVNTNQTIQIGAGDRLTIALGAYDFTGTGTFTLEGTSTNPSDTATTIFDVIGSTTAFKGGIQIHGAATLNYHGVYRSAGNDSIGELSNDWVIVNIIGQDEAWDAFGHDLTIGDAGTATFNISTGNWYKPTSEAGYPSYPGANNPLEFYTNRTTYGTTYGTLYHPADVILPRRDTTISADNPGGWSTGNFGESKNLILGNQSWSVGQFVANGKGTVWTNTDNTIVGKDGNGAFELADQAIFNTGNFVLNNDSEAVIAGNGTILNIYGTSADSTLLPTATGDHSRFHVKERAHVYVHYNDRMELSPTNGTGEAHLAISGTADPGFALNQVDNSYMNIDRGFIDNAAGNVMTFANFAYFEGSNWKKLVGLDVDPARINDATSGLDAAIRNNHYHTGHGSQVTGTLRFENNAVFAPGWGSQSLYETSPDFTVAGYWNESNMAQLYNVVKPWHERAINYESGLSAFGKIDMGNSGAVNIDAGGVALFDFDVLGNSNHAHYNDTVTLDTGTGQLGDYHKDYVNGTVNVTNGGHIHFRPMTGYYTDAIDIQFAEGGTVDANAWTVWPNR
ncbi:MAG: hypothetical protein LBJ67_11305, partial [Planctomycetaceae bacterium]|nr:hypothetical protein [Planctomycetaceae bacterium]